MPAKKRVFMVGERIQSVIARALTHLSDPRLDLVTISSVTVAADLRFARVYWTTPKDVIAQIEAKEALEGATGVFRRSIAEELNLRVTPNLAFTYDETLDVQDEVRSLFDKIQEADNKAERERLVRK